MEPQLMQQYQPQLAQQSGQFVQPEMQQYQPQLMQQQQNQFVQMPAQMMQLPSAPQTTPITQLPIVPQVVQQPLMEQQQTPVQPNGLERMEKPYSTFLDYNTSRLTCTEPEKEVMPGTGPKSDPSNPKQPQYYHNIPIKYNFGTLAEKNVGEFYFEGCEVTTLYGIKSEKNQYGKFKSSIAFILDETNQSQMAFMNCVDGIYAGAAQILFHYREKVGLQLFDASNVKMAHATGFKPLITRKAGKKPALYMDLIDFANEKFSVKTQFTYGEDGKVLEWKNLMNMTFNVVPLYRIKKIYVGGGKAALQWDIKSAVVTTPPVPFKSNSMQIDTMKQYAKNNSSWEESIASQIARNMMTNQDKMLGAHGYVPEQITPQVNIVQQQAPQVNGLQQQPQVNGLQQQPTPQINMAPTNGTLPIIPILVQSTSPQPNMSDFVTNPNMGQPTLKFS